MQKTPGLNGNVTTALLAVTSRHKEEKTGGARRRHTRCRAVSIGLKGRETRGII
jgi:hypothetical protein